MFNSKTLNNLGSLKVDRHLIQDLALYFYLFTISIDSITLGSESSFSISKAAGIFYLICILPSFKIFFSFNKNLYFLWPMAVFILLLTFVSLLNVNSFSSRIFYTAFLLNFFIFIGISNHTRKNILSLDRGILIFALGCLIPAFSVLLGFGIDKSYDFGFERVSVFGANSNDIALMFCASIIIIFVNVFQNYLNLGPLRYLLLLLIPVFIFSMLQTLSRTGILVLIITPVFWYFLSSIISKNKLKATFIGAFLLMLLLVPIVLFLVQSEGLLTRFSVVSEGNLGGREVLWFAFFQMILESWVWGYGLSGNDLVTYQFFGYIGETPHNIVLQVLMYTGVIGLLFYLIFLFRIFLASFRTLKETESYLPILLIPTLAGYLFLTQSMPVKFVWIVFAYIVSSFLYYKGKRI